MPVPPSLPPSCARASCPAFVFSPFVPSLPVVSTLAPGARQTVVVGLVPAFAGPLSARLPIKIAHNPFPLLLRVRATGVLMRMSVSPAVLDLGAVQPYQPSAPREITVTNTSDVPVPVEVIAPDFDRQLLEEEEILRQDEAFLAAADAALKQQQQQQQMLMQMQMQMQMAGMQGGMPAGMMVPGVMMPGMGVGMGMGVVPGAAAVGFGGAQAMAVGGFPAAGTHASAQARTCRWRPTPTITRPFINAPMHLLIHVFLLSLSLEE